MREKKRYILVKAEGLSPAEVQQCVQAALQEWLGEKGVALARARFVRDEPGGAWVKCSTKALEDTVAALALKRFFKGKDVALRTVLVAGSVPKAAKKV
ncbi:hypothetical protein HY572_07150 [Candidatus Micrarchaeota archaeon]|nr:hypothetical protein [Candidatus Micrarchaeota archaeon]